MGLFQARYTTVFKDGGCIMQSCNAACMAVGNGSASAVVVMEQGAITFLRNSHLWAVDSPQKKATNADLWCLFFVNPKKLFNIKTYEWQVIWDVMMPKLRHFNNIFLWINCDYSTLQELYVLFKLCYYILVWYQSILSIFVRITSLGLAQLPTQCQ